MDMMISFVVYTYENHSKVGTEKEALPGSKYTSCVDQTILIHQ
jgi:hypothetical protein